MRNITGILITIASLAVLLTAMNQGFVNRVKQDRYFDHLTPESKKTQSLYRKIFIRSDRWKYGDLYGMSFIPEYRIKLTPFKTYDNRVDKNPTNKVLYIIGDSFTADKNFNNAFDGFDHVIFLDRRFPFGPIKPDTTKQNYLIMEFSELNIANYRSKNSFEILNYAAIPPPFKPVSLFERIGNILFNKDLNKNIELLLFDDKVYTPFKALKASVNYYILGRLPKEVAVSTDKQRLLLNSTIDTTSEKSVFRSLLPLEIDSISAGLKIDQQRYLSLGFKKVYLSLIPNAASVYDEHRLNYNQLAPQIENKASVPLIPLYNIFKRDKRNLYSRSDAHWNDIGFSIWVTQVNNVLKASTN
ncbi:hypothetical protein [Mucilaginibacter glaciei]|uniref:AlgX/AlgJ SGNH hydrolase-like domain-containing protein n=1 Tax=Mucilaginibacter glaciei TaxID=2772109 RepID=A0A926NM98_9SPHI|nr:hypothetical protein [Mucilaginibacter glaciei]MBD1394709.1 hypothetical protein [Mucilaginibacter glaciei]